jgi:hypothetical protein
MGVKANMNNEIFSVITVIGPDRLGIAEDIARLVTSQGGNIEESKMAVLGGDFAAIGKPGAETRPPLSSQRHHPAPAKSIGHPLLAGDHQP